MSSRARGGAGLLCLSLLCAPLTPGCSDLATSAEESAPFEATVAALTPDGKASSAFTARQPIVLSLTVRNATDAPQVIEAPTSQSYDFAVSDESGRELWRWSAGRMFAQVLTELAFAPGETKRFEIRWDQRAAKGDWMAPGRYRVVGSVPARPRALTSGPTELTIR